MRNPRTFIVRDNIAVGVIPKCGNTSIREAMGDRAPRITPDEAMAYPIRLFLMRDPFERLKSAYRHFRSVYDVGSRVQADRGIELNAEILSSWESFVDYILVNEDAHWMPQVGRLKTTEGVFVPNAVRRLDDAMTVWGNYFTGKIPHNNATVPMEIPNLDYRIADINAYYAEDIATWRGVT